MNQTRVFTLEEVNRLVPRLQSLVGRQLARRAEIEERLKRLGDLLGEVPDDLAAVASDTPEVRALKRELVERVEQYRNGWREVEELGGVLKDSRKGLVDFYGRVEGNLVWLCWRYGEDEVNYYHALDEGFVSRRALNPVIKKHLIN